LQMIGIVIFWLLLLQAVVPTQQFSATEEIFMVSSPAPSKFDLGYQQWNQLPKFYQWTSLSSITFKGNFSQITYNLFGLKIGPKDGLLYAIGQPKNETLWNVYRFNLTTGMLQEPVFIHLFDPNVEYTPTEMMETFLYRFFIVLFLNLKVEQESI